MARNNLAVVSTEDVAPGDRLGLWGDFVCRHIGPLQADTFGDPQFSQRANDTMRGAVTSSTNRGAALSCSKVGVVPIVSSLSFSEGVHGMWAVSGKCCKRITLASAYSGLDGSLLVRS